MADAEYHVGQRKPGPSHFLRRLGDAIAKFPQQLAKEFLFVGLCRVVGWPACAGPV